MFILFFFTKEFNQVIDEYTSSEISLLTIASVEQTIFFFHFESQRNTFIGLHHIHIEILKQ